LSADAEAPATAEQLFDVETWGSRAADPAQPALYTWEGLSPDTAYKVFAAAKNEAGYSGLGVLDMQTTEQLEARVGDFYYSDGTWSTELDPNKTPIAIVVFKGLAAEYDDHLEYYKDREGNPMTKVNGYAVALWDATWMEGEDYPQGWTVWENQEYCGTSIMGTADDIDFRGYDNTQKIKAKAEELFGALSPVEKNYPACYYASVNYEYICPSPAKSSGWFFPSAYQHLSPGSIHQINSRLWQAPSGGLHPEAHPDGNSLSHGQGHPPQWRSRTLQRYREPHTVPV
jgi:hypothetical protein